MKITYSQVFFCAFFRGENNKIFKQISGSYIQYPGKYTVYWRCDEPDDDRVKRILMFNDVT